MSTRNTAPGAAAGVAPHSARSARKRRLNGQGTVFADTERGGYIGLVYIDGKRRKVRAKTELDAEARISRLLHDAEDGLVVIDGNATVGDVTKRWRERDLAARQMALSTRTKYLWAADLIDLELGRVRLRSLDVDRIEDALDSIASGAHGRGKPLTRASVGRVRDALAQILDFGVRRKMIATNPARLAIVTPTAPAAKSRRSLTPDEARQLWDALEGERLGAMFRLMLTTGLRPGEALGVCWDALDFDAGTLTVRRSVRLERGAARLVDELKTSSSYRTIGLPRPAIDVLRAQRARVAEAKLAARAWVTNDPGLVFPTDTGGPWNPKNARNELGRICRDAELPAISPNELRHTAASVLSDAGVPLELIADLLGHTSTRMLDQTYRHRVRPSVDAAVSVMGNMFARA